MKWILYFYFSFLIFSCSKQVNNIIISPQIEEPEITYMPSEKFDSITIIYTDSALIQLKLFGEKLYRYENYYNNEKNITKIEQGLSLNIYETNGSSKTKLTAEDAIIFENKDVIEFKKNVHYNSGDGLSLETDFLIWDKVKGTISVPVEEKVKVIDQKKGNIINGYGLESNGNFTKYKVTKVNGIIQIEQKSDIPADTESNTKEPNMQEIDNKND
jgi:LPS export ABC transporter protein LptC